MHADRPLISVEAEHGVLGALMHEPEQCEEVGAFLSPADFASEDHGALYTMILAAHSKKQRPDSITLSEIRAELPSGEMTIIYASEIMRNVPSASNGRAYARIVLERARARQLYAAGQKLMELAEQRGSVSEQIAQAQQITMDLAAHEEAPDVVTIRDALGEVFADMQDRLDGVQQMGLKFGLEDLDNVINGARPGNLIIIAGRPGTGKTVLGTGLADQIAIKHQGAALIFSLEMAQKELAKRSLASMSGVSQNWIESGEAVLDGTAKLQIEAAVARMSDADVRICDKPGLTFSRICSIARFQHRAKPLDLIVIDYLSLIASDPSDKSQNRNQELGAMTRGFKRLAKEMGIPIVVLAQLNRGIESRADKKPQMSDLRDSGEIEQDADIIMFIYRDEVYNPDSPDKGTAELIIGKHRNGPTGTVRLTFIGENTRFENYAAAPGMY